MALEILGVSEAAAVLLFIFEQQTSFKLEQKENIWIGVLNNGSLWLLLIDWFPWPSIPVLSAMRID
jgi:hypothetical protein